MSNANLSVSHAEFRDMALALCHRISPFREEYRAVLCPLRGGFYLSDFLSRRLGLPMEYIQISSYAGHESGAFREGFMPRLSPGRYLLCDDILATGRTVARIKELFPHVLLDAAFLYRHRQRALPCERTFCAREIDESVWISFPWEDESLHF